MSHQHVCEEWHNDSRHQEVSHRQRHDEVVGDVLERPLPGHREDDEDIAEDDPGADEEEEEGPVVLVEQVVLRVGCILDTAGAVFRC